MDNRRSPAECQFLPGQHITAPPQFLPARCCTPASRPHSRWGSTQVPCKRMPMKSFGPKWLKNSLSKPEGRERPSLHRSGTGSGGPRGGVHLRRPLPGVNNAVDYGNRRQHGNHPQHRSHDVEQSADKSRASLYRSTMESKNPPKRVTLLEARATRPSTRSKNPDPMMTSPA